LYLGLLILLLGENDERGKRNNRGGSQFSCKLSISIINRRGERSLKKGIGGMGLFTGGGHGRASKVRPEVPKGDGAGGKSRPVDMRRETWPKDLMVRESDEKKVAKVCPK